MDDGGQDKGIPKLNPYAAGVRSLTKGGLAARVRLCSTPNVLELFNLRPTSPSPSATEKLVGSSWPLFFTSLFAWAAVFHVTAIGGQYASPVTFAAFRTVLPLVILLVLLKRGRVRLPRPKLAIVVALSGLLSVSFFSYALADGVARAGAGDAAVLANSPPLWVALASVFIFRERLGRHAVTGLLVGFGGLLVMFSPQLHVSSGRIASGMLISVAAAVAYAIATIAMKLVANRDENLDPLGVMTLQHLAGCPALLIAAFAMNGTSGTHWAAPGFWATCIPAGMLSLVGATAYVTSLKKRSATHTSLVLFLVPVLALVIEIVFGKTPDTVTFAGMGIVIVGVGLVTRKSSTRRRGFRPLAQPVGGGRALTLAPATVYAAVAPEPQAYGAPAIEAVETA